MAIKAIVKNSFRAVMAVGFGLALAIVAGTVATVSGNPDAMGVASGLGFLFGCLGGWLRK